MIVSAAGLLLQRQTERIYIEGIAGGRVLHQRPETGDKNDFNPEMPDTSTSLCEVKFSCGLRHPY